MRSHYLFMVLIVAFSFLLNTTSAQQVNPQTTEPSITVHPTVIRTGTFLGVSPKLRDIKPIKKTDRIIGKDQVSAERNAKPEFNSDLGVRNYPYAATALPQGPDPVWQRDMGTNHAGTRAPILNFAGQSSPYMPSDCNGAVGANYFMQGVNSSYAIYNKNTGTQVVSSTAFNTLFSGVTGSNNNDGDIIVLYDDNAQRWFASEFDITSSNNSQMVAVSVTGDPTGSWYKWSFDVDDMPDYGKFGIWKDGYYFSDNNTTGNDVYVFDRATMLTGGASPQMVAFNNPNRPNSGFHCIEPLNCDGTFAPAGTPGQFITINDDAWGGSDQLWIYQCSVDWTTPSNSTFARTQTLTVPAFDSNLGSGMDNISQPGTSQKVDAIPQILMFRAQYRNFGTTQSIVCAHTVDVDNTDHAGIRWYELQNTGSSWSIRQSGTYAPDGDSRWLPSISMDSQHNISIGYNVSSSSTYPSIRYAAQSAAENATASGVLDIAEESIEAGTHSQTTANRWGDYAEMSIDPVDDVTFWFTTEYYNGGKKTKIADWRFGAAALPPNTNFVINTPNTLLRPVPILQGNSATFTNLTTGQVDNWSWTFQGGTPGTSTVQDPGSITYNTTGLYDVSLYADNTYGDSTLTRTDYIKVIDPTVVTCDTLVQFYGTPTVYKSSGGGYVGGTNEYTCHAIAEKFDNFSPYNKITGGRFYWAQATNGTSPNVTFVLWGDDGSGAPGTQLATKVVPLSDIVNDMATSGYTDIAFPADVPLPSTGAFFLGFEIPGDAASGDTLAVATNKDSDGPDDTGYSLYSGWESYSAWSMSLMNTIFAYGCYDPYMPPVADFKGVPTTVNAGNTVAFTDLSYGGTPTSWSWSFPGGTPNTSTAQNPTITYNTAGYYDATLTVTNAYGTDSITKTNYIHVVDPNSCSCGELGNVVGSQVLYTAGSGKGYVSGNNTYGDEAKAEYFATYSPYTEINGAYLYFGYAYVANTATNITINIWDNTGTGGAPGTIIATQSVPITTIENDVNNGDSTYVAFPAVSIPGPFYIGFIIPNPSSAGDTVALMSGQQNSSSPNTAWEKWSSGTWYAYSDGSSWGGDWNLSVFPVVCTTGAPLVDFSVNNTLVAAGNTLDFTDLSTCGPTAWSWNFGGGGTPNTSTNQNPSITYNTAGVYDVTLTASNGSGSNSEMKTSYITVLEPIVYWDFPNNPDDNTADGGIAANLSKTIGVFGGATLQGFASAGASTNSAQARNFANGSGSKGWQVDFTTSGYGSLLLYSKQNGDARSPQDWKVQYSLDGSTWVDVSGATITVANDWTTGVLNGVSLPAACENQPTVYLRWILTSNNGIGGSILNGRDNLIDDIMVAGIAIGSPPVADFSANTTSTCENGTINFTDLSTNSPTSWDWDFGDGTTHATQQNPSHIYAIAGTYTVVLIATNSAGSDTKTKTNYITVNASPTVSTSVTDVNCFGGNDGDATATPAGGTAPYGFAWNNSGSTATISGLTAGTYTVTVTDANTCTGTGTATVSQPATALSANITASSNVSCNGGSDGSATVTASGGTSPYSYTWPSSGTNATETGLAAGSYTVTVTDANSCTTTATANISEPATALSTSISGTDVNCNGGSDGTATVTAGGGTSPYTYLWGGGQNTASISGLTAGTYNCTITDANGCTSNESITISEPATALSTSISGTDVNCNGGSDGTATVTAGGGTSPYTYLWGGGQNTASISTLTAGTYNCTITDANGCTSNESITINEPATALTASISSTNVTCNGDNDGTADVTASGGTSPYTYLWSNSGTTNSISGLSAGSYTVTVTDNNNCTATATVSITEPSALSTSISGTDVLCNGGSTGTASASASGGTSPYSYLWSTSATTNSINGLIAGTYSCTITDANNCTSTGSITINEPAALSTTMASNDASCNGASDGDATVTVSGGTTPYTYVWSSGGTTNSETGLTAGTYTVTVTDANGCTITDNATIGEPSAIVINETHNDETCGSSNGDATVSVSGGTSPYSYLWSTGGTTNSISGLAAGSYTVTVTDANTCSNTLTVSISNISGPTVTTSKTNVTCNGGNDGTATVTPSGGTLPYTYLWSSGGTGATETGLTAGSYTVTVTDNNGCTATATVSITEPSALSTSISGTDVLCNGGSTGTASVSASGGTTPYTYLWSTGGTTNTINGLVAGSYSCTITDANSCTSTESITINEPAALSTTMASNDASCNGTSDGDATVTVSGGTTPYSYVWSSGGTGSTETGLTAGTYTVTVTDANGCTITDNATIGEPSAIVINETHNDATCGSSNGDATVTVSGGTSPYTYLWPSGGTSATETGLSAGSYTVTVTDANTCSNTLTVSISSIGGPSLTTSSTDVTCNGGSDGTADVTATGGTPPYTYLWSNGGTTASETGLSAGSYSVTVTDANTCSATASVTINEPSAITATSTILDASCNGSSDGSISLTVSGGTSPYTYLWSSGGTSATESGLPAGTYDVTVTDANSCTYTNSYTVSEPSAISISTTSTTDVTCNGGSDGSATISVSGGTSPYTYAWPSGGGAATETGLSAGSYTVTVTDANSCTATQSITINEPTAITLSTSSTDATCGASNGTADVTVSGGTSPYTYLWSTGGTTNSITGLAAGSYGLTVTDANSCQETTSVTISDVGGATLTMTSTDVTCNGGSDGTATVTATGGTSPYTYLWSSGGTTSSETGLIAGNYNVTVTDNNGCSSTASVTINQPTAITATSSITNVSCNGGSDGSVSINVSGGTSPYTYAWSSGGSGTTESGLIAGSYDVTITDANNCTLVETYNVTEPSAISISTTSTTDVTCNGGTDGSVTISVSGGTSPYTYAWPSGGGAPTETGLSAGTYDVTVTDANSCTATQSITINEPTAITLTTSSTDATCGASNGTADVTVSGGTSPYTYLWSTGGTNNSITALSAGTYGLTVSDNNGCQETTNVIVNNTGGPTLTVSVTDVLCNGGTDGEANVSATGGTSPYTYLWSTGGTDSTETGLIAGTYTVTVTDNNSCSSSIIATVNQPSVISVSETITDASCGGCTDGSIDLGVTGGTSPYTFAWSSGGTGATESGLAAGTYDVTITDANGCTDVESYTVTAPNAITINVDTVIDVTCNGGSDGSATISVTGGVSPYTYTWSSGGVGSTETGLSAGTYTVTVTDANSTTATQTVTVNEPTAITVSFTTNDANCGSSDGSATASITGGTTPYTYLWSTGSTTNSINSVSAGTYYLTVTDAASCQIVDSVIIGNIGGPTLTISGTDVTCYGAADGSAMVVATGGTTPYTYLWSTGGTNDSIANLSGGTYTVTVTDAGGCLSTESITINEPAEIVITDSIVDASCGGNADGSIALTVTGGTYPYSYIWSDGGTGSSETGLIAGTYDVTVSDNNGCTAIGSYTINAASGVSLTLVSSNDVNCNGGNDGTATVAASNGINPISYVWSNNVTGQTAYNLSAGTYTVTATDANNCSDTLSVTISEPPAITVNVITNDAHCGNSDGNISVTVTGGTTPYTYLWSNGATTSTLSDLAMGIYVVTITDANGCEHVSTNIINNLNAPTVMVTGTDVGCFGGDDGTATAMATGGIAPYTYLWNSGGTAAIENGLTAGNYTVTVTDVNNCSTIGTFRIEQPAFGLSVSSTVTDASCPEKTDGEIDLDVKFGTPPYNFSWNSGENYEDLTDIATGAYVVTVTDMNNCSTTDSIVVGTVQSTCLHVYNTITPNGDGKNDTWIIDGIQYYPNCAVKVFNQWGNMVYSSTGYPENWDGTNNGHPLPAATYYYIIDLGNGDNPITGDLTIIRSVGNRMPIGPNHKKKKPDNKDNAENLIIE